MEREVKMKRMVKQVKILEAELTNNKATVMDEKKRSEVTVATLEGELKEKLVAVEKINTDLMADLEAMTLNNEVSLTKLVSTTENLKSKLDKAMRMNK